MINAIGAMHAALRTKQKRPEDNINFRVEMKKRRRLPQHDDEDEDEHPPSVGRANAAYRHERVSESGKPYSPARHHRG